MLSLRKEGFALKIGKVLSKENTGNALTKIGGLRLKMSHSSVLHISLLLIIKLWQYFTSCF